MNSRRLWTIIAFCLNLVPLFPYAASSKGAPPKPAANTGLNELVIEEQFKNRDYATLEGWVAQLNAQSIIAATSQDRDERVAKGKVCQSLVYGIEKQREKFNLYALTDDDKSRIDKDMSTLNRFAEAYYQQDADRWRRQKSEDLRFGEEQVRAMMHDRPEMSRCVSEGDALWKWAARQFAGEGVGTRVYWEKTEPPDIKYPAAHWHTYSRPYSENPLYFHRPYIEGFGLVRIHSVKHDFPGSCEVLWACAVYELNNIQNTPGFQKVSEDAHAGKLTKEQFVRGYANLEWEAAHKTALFYRRMWLPQSMRKNEATHPSWWQVGTPITFEAWMTTHADRSKYPWDCYSKYYDLLVQHSMQMNRFQQEVKQLEDASKTIPAQ
jgi:hypothetical protein